MSIEKEVPFPVAAMVTHCCGLLRARLAQAPRAGVIIGCGNGDEVVYARRELGTNKIFGIDVESEFSARARAENCVARSDALRLPFLSTAFDFAAAFHSLEHVSDPVQALEEIWRVLRPGGWLYAGVPNRTRLLGYLGSFDATFWEKISWNAKDWRARLRGDFRNEAGAHAGFDREELLRLLDARFCNVQFLTEEYLRFKYGRRLPRAALNLLLSPHLINFTAPAHYAICQKAAQERAPAGRLCESNKIEA
ncbi:MAG: methyltransferase domain-containing protein [Terriglobia bacterium]